MLFGAMLHAADRFRQGKSATDLERTLLGVLRAALTDAEIRDWGRVYREAVNTLGRPATIPEVIARRPVTSGYTLLEHVLTFGPVAAEHAARPNMAFVDRETLAAGGDIDTPRFREGMREDGFGVTVFRKSSTSARAAQTAENTGNAAQTGDADAGADERTTQSFRAKLELESFHCHRAVGDAGGGRDEIYWCSASASDKQAGEAYMSEEFGGVKKGQTRTFGSNRVVFDGQASTGVVLNMWCWEADDSPGAWYDKLQTALTALKQQLFDTWQWQLSMGLFDPTIVGSALAEIMITAVLIIEKLRNDDDLSSARGIILDQFDLALMAHRGTTDFHFDGDGHHSLKMKYTGDSVPFPVGTLEYAVRTGDTWGAPISLPWKSMSPPALASFRGALHAMYIREGDKAVMWTVLRDGVWSEPQHIGGWLSLYAPTLTDFRGTLHCVLVGLDNRVYSSTSTDGTSWTNAAKVGNFWANRPVGLAATWSTMGPLRMRLYMTHTGGDDVNNDNFHDGTRWTTSATRSYPWRSYSPISMTGYGANAYRAMRETDNRVRFATGGYPLFGGTDPSWSDGSLVSGWRISAGPTLTIHQNLVWIFFRDNNSELCTAHYNPQSREWSSYTHVFKQRTTKPMRETGAASHQNKLYAMYHRQ
ncbi:hypothetical protein B7P34_01415 [Streptosporangium nondiastaticum]|uniref:Uncharacterized protein n=1 Tax=Streptosporangium nondiastaticum TaxID=35764 RepID=A0A9X7PJX5_9ACTN|nr:hypothetical protein B7P34_01415 [Streptosporangium nondiastaticum]